MRRRLPAVQPQARGSRTTTFRDEILAMHRAIFRRNQTRINRSVLGYTPAFRRYEREYARVVESYRRRATHAQLERAIARASVVYTGDYHTLPQAQRAFLRLLRQLPRTVRVTVALESVEGRHQRHLDAFLKSRMGEKAFLRAIDHTSRWAFGGDRTLREILELVRRRGWRAIGIDSAGQGPAGASLRARDRYAARRVADAVAPGELVMVLIGELHIAPSHLPAVVDRVLAQRGKTVRHVIVYQNCHEIYWQLERRNLEHEVEVVRVATDQFCLMNTPPIVCQQSFLNWLEIDDAVPSLEAPEENFKEYARLIARFFDLPLGDQLDEVELTTVVDLSFLSRLRKRGDFSTADMQIIREQILRSESYFIPRANMVYLGNLSVNHAAEEATHYLRYMCAHADEPRLLVDAFYARTIEEAMGFLGSKLLNHKRRAPALRELQRQARSRSNDAHEREVARLVLKHAGLEEGRRVRRLESLYESDAETFNAVTHLLGYRLGERLYYGLLSGVVGKSEIRALFFDPLRQEGAPLAIYLHLTMLTSGVRIPERV